MTINWNVSRKDHALIDEVVRRAHPSDPLSLAMDLTACHANGNRLDLARLLTFPDLDFYHDVYGISAHIDRTTGKLRNFFVPRCTARRS